jgi:putative chitinase
MNQLSIESLRSIMPLIGDRAETFLQPLNDAMEIYEIDTPQRQAAFLAQLAHESGELRYMRELADGKGYEGRKDLGNVHEGDGVKFKGRGPIQITGRVNYMNCSLSLYGDERLLEEPALLEKPRDGCMAAGWFWSSHGLNALADVFDFKAITRRINGGENGMESRERYYTRAVKTLGGLV